MALTDITMVIAFLACLLICPSQGQTKPHSCMDLYKSNTQRSDGTYTIYNRKQQSYTVYCEFNHGYGYTFISKATAVEINIADLYTDTTHFLARDLRSNGRQYETRVEQMTSYKHRPLSFQYNAHAGYSTPQNVQMAPYIYVGFLPESGIHHSNQREGYRVNGVDFPFTNCDGNANNYIAFLFNTHNRSPTGYTHTSSDMAKAWVDKAIAVPSSNNLPASFFSFFEVHFGGCGGYVTLSDFHSVRGAAIGLRFDVTCSEPHHLSNGVKMGGGTAIGSEVRYSCNHGYSMVTGDAVRHCVNTGEYTGLMPVCGQTPCNSSPCQNGGSCYDLGTSYACECPDDKQGANCELPA